MSEPDDPPPSYEDIMTGGISIDPPKYSNSASQMEEGIGDSPNATTNQTATRAPHSATTNQTTTRAPHSATTNQTAPRIPHNATTNQTAPRIPQSVPGRAPRGKWYGKHHLVPSSTPTRTMCQREANLDAPPSIRMLMQQERSSLDQHSDDFWPDKKISTCCLIAILVAVVLFILMLGRVITMIEDKEPLDTDFYDQRQPRRPVLSESTTKFDLSTTFKNCSQFSIYSDGENYTQACFTPPPSIEYGSYIPAVQPKQCYDEDMKLVEYFSEGTKVTLSCNPNKVLSSNLVFLDPGYKGSLATTLDLSCTRGSWKYSKWSTLLQIKDFPVDCITETELIKRNIG